MKIRNNKGFTLIELLIVVAIIGIIAAIAVPGLLRARQSGNETSAIGSLRAVHSSNTNYAGTCGGGGYMITLVGLFTNPNGVPFISPDLSTDPAVKSGYTVSLADGDAAAADVLATGCNGVGPTRPAFWSGAVPVSVGSSGQRSFAVDNRGTIYFDATGAAIANPIPAATQFIQ